MPKKNKDRAEPSVCTHWLLGEVPLPRREGLSERVGEAYVVTLIVFHPQEGNSGPGEEPFPSGTLLFEREGLVLVPFLGSSSSPDQQRISCIPHRDICSSPLSL